MIDPNPINNGIFLRAFQARAGLVDPRHETAFRLFNGFLEGDPDLVLEIYGKTLLVYNYAGIPGEADPKPRAAIQIAMAEFPWIHAVVLKTRSSESVNERHGTLLIGNHADQKIQEHGVWYALDLLMSRDASFYLDTRNLRSWALKTLGGKSVLNTFAYTGSLGVAALAGGASQVVQMDLKARFLDLAKTSYILNGFTISQHDFIAGDFWTVVNRLKRQAALFDCVFIDPPFFSSTSRGQVDLVNQGHRVINKVRPLIKDGGWLVSINNALFLSGAGYLNMLEWLCADGYLSIDELIPAPEDVIGFTHTIKATPPVDPSPFNHSTKIAILRVRRKHAE